jgi:Ohr subfamily peroxiredoxin
VPGSNRPGTTPEQLFAAAWGACFEGALKFAAKETGIPLPPETAVDASVQLNRGEAEGFFLTAQLEVSLPGLAVENAKALIGSAHDICPVSKMTRDGIDATVSLVEELFETSKPPLRQHDELRLGTGSDCGEDAPSPQLPQPGA